MLEFFRTHKKLRMALMLIVVVPGLGFFGVTRFLDFFNSGANVAKVNGYTIARTEFDNTMRQQLDMARAQPGFDESLFDTPQNRQAILDGMIRQRVLGDETQRLHLSAPDEAVHRAEMNDPAIAALKKPDGLIDLDRYRDMLARQGMTPDQYDARVRSMLIRTQLPGSIVNSMFVPKALVERTMNLFTQQRDVQGLMLRAENYAAKVQVSDAQAQAYYDAHQGEFAVPTTAQIQYVVLSPDAVAASIHPSDDDLHRYYQGNLARWRTPEQVRASHIMIAVPQGASATVQAAARQKAEAILAEVKAHPAQFAQIAQKESQDAGSAARGGDLGWVDRGGQAGAAFDDAVFKLKKDEISGVIESNFGYHIVKVTDMKPATTTPFGQVKAVIEPAVKAQMATNLLAQYEDTNPQNPNAFPSIVYQQSKSLQPAANRFKLTIQTATVTPKPDPALPPQSPLNNAKFLAAVFAGDSLNQHNNTQAIDVGNSTMIAARVTHYQPAGTPAFATIKDAVRQKMVVQQAVALARKDGEAKLAELKKTKSTAGFSPMMRVALFGQQPLPPEAVSAIYKADVQNLPAYVGVDLGNAGYAIFRIAALGNAPVDAAQQEKLRQNLEQVEALSQTDAYLESLRARAKVKLYGSLAGNGQGGQNGQGENQ